MNEAKRYDKNENGCKKSYLLKILAENRVSQVQIREYIVVLDQRLAQLVRRLDDLKGMSPVESKSESEEYDESEQDLSIAVNKEQSLLIKASGLKLDTTSAKQ